MIPANVIAFFHAIADLVGKITAKPTFYCDRFFRYRL
jgi:hypothetical protein